jgi:hypothetical protein
MNEINEQPPVQPNIPPQPAVYSPPQAPRYYSLEPAPEERVPIWKQKKIQLLLGIALGVMILATVGIIVGSNLMQNSDAAKTRRDALTRAQVITDSKTSECDDGDTACLERAQSGAARSVGEVEACNGLQGDRYASCVTLIALDKEDPALCDALSKDAKTSCADGALSASAKEKHDFTLCGKINDEISRLSCEAAVRSDAAASGKCDEYHVDASVCSDETELKAVIAAGDPKGCSTLEESVVDSCEDLFSSLDQDEDGLMLRDEFAAGTSDMKADTDGDGYTDKEEIESGHNPTM